MSSVLSVFLFHTDDLFSRGRETNPVCPFGTVVSFPELCLLFASPTNNCVFNASPTLCSAAVSRKHSDLFLNVTTIVLETRSSAISTLLIRTFVNIYTSGPGGKWICLTHCVRTRCCVQNKASTFPECSRKCLPNLRSASVSRQNQTTINRFYTAFGFSRGEYVSKFSSVSVPRRPVGQSFRTRPPHIFQTRHFYCDDKFSLFSTGPCLAVSASCTDSSTTLSRF